MIDLLKKQQNRNKKLIALIDGEHYPQVNLDAINLLKKYFTGSFEGIIFLGGTEKISGGDPGKFYGCRVFQIGELDRDFPAALDEFRPDFVYDLSDEPVVDYFKRMKIASFCFSRSSSYMGPDFYFEYEHKRIKLSRPSLMIIGTGKRIGKTAVSSYIAGLLSEKSKVCIIAMGRGGPRVPRLIRTGSADITPEFLLKMSRKGLHASSDYIEDALFTNADTVGCRRCGGGFGGRFFFSNIGRGVKIAEKTDPQIIVIEGSGASVPPVDADRCICVVGANQDWQSIAGYLGIYRMLISDIIFLTMCEEPVASDENILFLEKKIRQIKKDARIVKSVFRPRPLYSVKGKNIFLVITAGSLAGDIIKRHLETEYGCKVTGMSLNLSDRKKLYMDLKSSVNYDMLLTELKAASVDMVTEFAFSEGKEINYLNNIPVITHGSSHIKNLLNRIRVGNEG